MCFFFGIYFEVFVVSIFIAGNIGSYFKLYYLDSGVMGCCCVGVIMHRVG